MKTVRKWVVSLLSAALCLSMLAAPAGAYSRVDTEKKCSLTLTYNDTERSFPMKDMELRLYKVADMDATVRFSVDKTDFKDLKIDWADFSLDNDKAKENWDALTTTLAGYVTADLAEKAKDEANYTLKYNPVATKKVDDKGEVKFAGLDCGLYLLMGSALKDGRYTYTPKSTLLTLPNLEQKTDAEGNVTEEVWQYDVAANGKWDRSYKSGGGGTNYISLSVLKQWEDDSPETRPGSVTVRLMKDGKEYDEVTLTASKGWKHTWNNLDKNAEWTLAEVDVPDEYTVLVDREGNTFVVTNTGSVIIPTEPLPEGPVDPGKDPGTGGEGGDGSLDIPDEKIPQGNLPQTGVLWWPVQALTLVGLVLFVLGWADARRVRKNEK